MSLAKSDVFLFRARIKPDILLVITPNNRNDSLYASVKKACSLDEPAVISQVVAATTINKAKGKNIESWSRIFQCIDLFTS